MATKPDDKTQGKPPWSRQLVLIQLVTSTTIVVTTRVRTDNWGWLTFSFVGLAIGLRAIQSIGPKRVSISPEVRPETQLVTHGPYRFIRHPMYTALLLFCGGMVFTPLHWMKVVMWFVLLIVLIVKSRIEERQLHQRFKDYADYALRSRRFVPFVW